MAQLIFFVNGHKVLEPHPNPEQSLADYLRLNLGLKGTKIGCNEGGCGACTVMISEIGLLTNKIHHYSVNACLFPLCAAYGKAVITVEGIGSTRNRLHPVQERLSKGHGSQCGFCTPGFVMAMYALLRTNPQPTTQEIDETLQGNLCRCTGYRPIMESLYSFSKVRHLTNFASLPSYDPSQEPIFPPELMHFKSHLKHIEFNCNGLTWFRPSELAELLHLKQKFPHGKIVLGNTEIGIEQRFKDIGYSVLIDPRSISELYMVENSEKNGLFIGSALSISETEEVLKQAIHQLPESKSRIFRGVVEMVNRFAGKHIRNTATVVGNIATASPISDLNPLWLAAGATLVVQSEAGGRKEVSMDENFFTGYRKTVLRPEDVILGLWIPYTNEAQRRNDDIAIVNAGMKVTIAGGTSKIQGLKMAFGGMAPKTVMSLKAMASLNGCLFGGRAGFDHRQRNQVICGNTPVSVTEWNDKLMDMAIPLLLEDLSLDPGVPGGMERFRQTLCLSFFFKFYLYVKSQLGNIDYEKDSMNTTLDDHGPMEATQLYQEVATGQPETDHIHRPIILLSADKHTTGEAVYCDDVEIPNALHMASVLSEKSHAKILNVDYSEALAMSGVVSFIDWKDVPENSQPFGSGLDTVPFPTKEHVSFYGQPIAAIIAEQHVTARKAAKRVKIDYQELDPVITIEVRIGGQEHFYMEPQTCYVIPGEDNEMNIVAATQSVTELQEAVSMVMGIPHHKVTCSVKRVGGGFGGKETGPMLLATTAAIAAKKLRKPIKCTLERYDDMVMTGTRHPFLGKFKVGFSNDGQIMALDSDLYSNAGVTTDASLGVMKRALFHIDNGYKIPQLIGRGWCCRTNIQSCTAFRGYGIPQAQFVTEVAVNKVAETLGMDPEMVRHANLFEEDDRTVFGQRLTKCNIRRCWDECKAMAEYSTKRWEIDTFNSQSRYVKRGIAIVPTRFGAGFATTKLNQAGALVHIYTDGSVLISHAGMEMGQGLHTKIAQIAASTLRLPMEKFHIEDTATDKVPNSTVTGASVTSDINGFAVKNACEILLQRLAPYMFDKPKGSWESWVKDAYADRVSLSTTGFYKTPYVEPYNWETGQGNPYLYFIYGVACCQVEIDCLTGDHKLHRVDIVMDIGDSLNPAVDIGQIEGAYIQVCEDSFCMGPAPCCMLQGYGLFTMEELKCSPKGLWYTRGPGTYKIPSADDIPRQFYVKLLQGSSNKTNIFSSKAVGEPALFLGSSAFFAIKDAVKSARKDAGLPDVFTMDSPATPETIRMSCVDKFTQEVPVLPQRGTYEPWTVHL